jgi:hypothetical protein
MAKQTSLFLPTGYNTGSVTFTSADTTTLKTLFTAGANDSDVKAINVATDDTSAVNLKLYVTRGGTDYLLGTINVPIASGSNGTVVSVDVINDTSLPSLPIDSAGKRFIPLKTGDVIKVGCLATMTAAKTTTVSAFGQDY